MRYSPHTRHRPGFTLVELLVVIGIIAVLIGILLPVLHKARDSSNRTACMSNMRQIMIAATMYANDNHDWLPYTNWGFSTPRAGWLYTYSAIPALQAAITIEDGTPPPGIPIVYGQRSGTLWKYIKTSKVYHCPADTGPYPPGSIRNITSYLMNGECSSDSNSVNFRIPDFKPGAAIFMENSENSDWSDGSNYANEGIPDRHGHAGSIGAVDGSVAWVLRTTIQNASQSANIPNRFFCDPSRAGAWKQVD